MRYFILFGDSYTPIVSLSYRPSCFDRSSESTLTDPRISPTKLQVSQTLRPQRQGILSLPTHLGLPDRRIRTKIAQFISDEESAVRGAISSPRAEGTRDCRLGGLEE